VSLPILAMGGICTWQDAMEFFYAGASAIAVGTYNFVNLRASVELIDGLEKHFADRGMTLKDIIGKAGL